MEVKRKLNNPYGSKLDSANLLILGIEGLLPGGRVPVRVENTRFLVFPLMIARCLLPEICGLRRLLVRSVERVAQRGQQGLTLLRHPAWKRVDTLTPDQIPAD